MKSQRPMLFGTGSLRQNLEKGGLLICMECSILIQTERSLWNVLTIYGPKAIIYISQKIALMIVRPEVTDFVAFSNFNSFFSQKTCMQYIYLIRHFVF